VTPQCIHSIFIYKNMVTRKIRRYDDSHKLTRRSHYCLNGIDVRTLAMRNHKNAWLM